MPGFLTHYTFGTKVVEKLPDSYIKECINKYKKVYNLGLQGPDIFFYFIPYKLNKNLNLGSIMHRNKTKDFFLIAINKAIKCKDIAKKEVMIAYICGFYGHFTLDKNCHPYIYYKSNYMYTKKNYNEKHIKLESDIDYIYARKLFKAKYIDMNYQSTVKLNKREREVVASLINEVCNKLYDKIWINQFIAECIILNFGFIANFFNDKNGRKYKYLNMLERIITKNESISSLVNGNYYKIKYFDPMNINNKVWFNPWNGEHKMECSFYELSKSAMKELKEFTEVIEKCINDRKIKRVNEYIKNCSYITGLEI